MTTPRVSVISASIRPEGLLMVGNCLAKQSLTDFEWIVTGPAATLDKFRAADPRVRKVVEPPKRPGDFYRLNGAWQAALAVARAPLLVFAVDWIHFPAHALESFALAHDENPLACVTSVGHHYRMVIDGRPEVRHTDDQRPEAAEAMGYAGGACPSEFYELSLASCPRDPLVAVGGFDEDYDRVRGMSEKEAAARLEAHGCTFHLGLTPEVEHRIFSHTQEVAEEAWQPLYLKAREMYHAHAAEVKAGTRKTIPFGGDRHED